MLNLYQPFYLAIYVMQFQVFVQCDSDLMLARRIKRDVKERARSVEGILDQSVYLRHYGDLILTLFQFRYLRYVKPSYDNFVRPSSSHADIVRRHMPIYHLVPHPYVCR